MESFEAALEATKILILDAENGSPSAPNTPQKKDDSLTVFVITSGVNI
jgi:hypothetical protein